MAAAKEDKLAKIGKDGFSLLEGLIINYDKGRNAAPRKAFAPQIRPGAPRGGRQYANFLLHQHEQNPLHLVPAAENMSTYEVVQFRRDVSTAEYSARTSAHKFY
ncbi:hypothetical protein C2S52_014457 [Perilla frutescens var. hirtella]|uniref:Uncharacterized protein n=1 Tax=Perilla frutescens var. hirtella TaxID=608512 RepID=A0AAD4P9N7_PERFH|nr:hypothetical protein C2S52_014457 [Perilla frutescens var. hirtella]KAH6808668.1 hypothetical protein C2S51_026451 [Perilla frutescens var. frutescens]KAH6816684.1 hypothetical protein C2S51_021504 [Perilla frutescens var. frutescens]KAH6831893.1 hypothetical protein C2S53_012768 [Perilla frutescens var. hirtella]